MAVCEHAAHVLVFVDKVRALVKHICWAIHKQTNTYIDTTHGWMDVSELVAGAHRLYVNSEHSSNTVCERAFRRKRNARKRCEEEGSEHKQNQPYARRDTHRVRELIKQRCWCAFGTAYDRIEFILWFTWLYRQHNDFLLWLRLSHINEFRSNSHRDSFCSTRECTRNAITHFETLYLESIDLILLSPLHLNASKLNCIDF